MLKQFMLGAAALAIVGGVAFAENAATPAPAQPGTQVADAAANPPPPPPPGADQQGDDGQGWWGRHMRHHGWRHGGMGPDGMGGPGMRGPGPMAMNGPMGGPGPMMDHQGFHLTLGPGITVGVMCGKDSLKDCIAEAQPLIDAAKAAATAAPAPKTP